MSSSSGKQTFLTYASTPSDSSQRVTTLRYSVIKPTMPTKKNRPAPKRCAPCYRKRFEVCDPQRNPLCKLANLVDGDATTIDYNNSVFPAPGAENLQPASQRTGVEVSGIQTGKTENFEQAAIISTNDSATFNVGDRSILNVAHINQHAPEMQQTVQDSNGTNTMSTSEQPSPSNSFNFNTPVANGGSKNAGATGASSDIPKPETHIESVNRDKGAVDSLPFGKLAVIDQASSLTGNATNNDPVNTESLLETDTIDVHGNGASIINNEPATTIKTPCIENANDHAISEIAGTIANTTRFSPATVERLLTPDASSLTSVALTPTPDAMETHPAAPGGFSSSIAALNQEYQESQSEVATPACSLITVDEPMVDAPDTRDEPVPTSNNITSDSDSVRDVATLTDNALTGYNQRHLPLHDTGLNALVGQMGQEPESALRLLLGCMDEYTFDIEILRSAIQGECVLLNAMGQLGWVKLMLAFI